MKHRLFSAASALLISTGAAVQAAAPEFSSTKPLGLQRGSETAVTFNGRRLDDFESLIFYTPGLSLKSVGKVEKNKVEAVVTVGPEVPLGSHMVRLRTRTGVSVMRSIYVGPYPSLAEVEPNNDLKAPQAIAFGQTVEGVVSPEDVDYFKLTAKKGERISLEVEGMRLGYQVFDPFISVMDKNRFEIASSDDTVLHRQDGFLSVLAPEDGEYIVQVRESSYRGTATAFYRLHVGNFRRPDVCYPSGGKAGTTQKVKFIENDGSVVEEEITLPGQPQDKYMVYTKQDAPPSGNVMRVSPFENYLEVEPNDQTPNKTGLAAPCALNGIIEKPGDEDRFSIKLTKGMKVDFYGYAQSLGSPLDPVLVVTNSKGAQLGANDDGGAGAGRRLDCKLTITAPADDEYNVIVKDHLGRGGPNFVYRIEAVASVPSVTFSSPQFSVNDTHKRQFIAVPKGGRYATLVNVVRVNAAGDMEFETPNLPKGVKLVNTALAGSQNSIALLFEADADAPLGGAAVPINLKYKEAGKDGGGRLAQSFDMVRSGNNPYYYETVDHLPVAVVEEAPYTLELVESKVPLVANGQLTLKVIAKRKDGFKAPIRVLMFWRPAGVNSQGEVEIPAEKNEATFVFDSNGAVSPGVYPLTVLGESDAGNGIVYQASKFTNLTIAPAYLTGTMALTAVEQGKEGEFICKLEHALPFEGEAEAQVVGVPEGITVPPMKITKDTKEVTFVIKTTPTSAVGKHANLFCQVQVPVQGGFATHRIAGGATLRVDAPRKAPAAAPAKPAPAAQLAAADKPKEEPPKKQLSRLEQLRLEQSKGAP